MTEMASLVLFAVNPAATAAFYRGLAWRSTSVTTVPALDNRAVTRISPPGLRPGRYRGDQFFA